MNEGTLRALGSSLQLLMCKAGALVPFVELLRSVVMSTPIMPGRRLASGRVNSSHLVLTGTAVTPTFNPSS
jgi:hypothetical protein